MRGTWLFIERRLLGQQGSGRLILSVVGSFVSVSSALHARTRGCHETRMNNASTVLQTWYVSLFDCVYSGCTVVMPTLWCSIGAVSLDSWLQTRWRWCWLVQFYFGPSEWCIVFQPNYGFLSWSNWVIQKSELRNWASFAEWFLVVSLVQVVRVDRRTAKVYHLTKCLCRSTGDDETSPLHFP